jgi:hypothetical protein
MLVSRSAEEVSLQVEEKRKRCRTKRSRVSTSAGKRNGLSNQGAEVLEIGETISNVPLVEGIVFSA